MIQTTGTLPNVSVPLRGAHDTRRSDLVIVRFVLFNEFYGVWFWPVDR